MSPLVLVRAGMAMSFVLSMATAACGGRSDSGSTADAADLGNGGGTTRVAVDPCALLTNQEIGEQLFLAVSPAERPSWTTPEFDVTPTEVDWGEARRCEYRFQSRYAVGGGPVWHSDFNVMVIRAEAIGVPERDRLPVAGAGPDVFRDKSDRLVYYVTKGGHAVTLTAFPGEEAGRVVLLGRIAARLP